MQKKLLKKVSVLGSPKVGKTSLIARYIHNIFDDKYLMTIGTKVSKKVVNIGETELTLLIWDIAGQEVEEGKQSYYSRGTASAFLVFDLTKRNTFEHLEFWVNSLFSTSGKTPFIILANKSDLENKEVSKEEIEEFAKKYDAKLFFTSARTGENVETAFQFMATQLFEMEQK